jgi:hypothetical protein
MPNSKYAHFGSDHPGWKGGSGLNEKGYVRITAREHRNKYQHRQVMEELLEHPLCADYVFPDKGVIPKGMTVDQMDHRRTHNCHQNLMMLQDVIHNAISRAYRKYMSEHWLEWEEMMRQDRERESVPDWVVEVEGQEEQTDYADGQSGDLVE